ncbi:MAG: FAD-dependent oxidoreductase [Acidobacteria bacterium]|jgi:NADPH-dependent glutamate synthase beta subunit-like oxidoreductase/dihydroorotate dehydrogenase|nr:FAD-dependent oxidoreductase [Acidobacteriota bacterium]
MKNNYTFLTDSQLKYEIEKCENCAEKPCRNACPSGCSPMDFILACKVGLPSDFRRAAARILSANPLGGICGVVCPEKHCMSACVYKGLNTPVNIPAVQATIIENAKRLDVMPAFTKIQKNGKKIAVIGAGPSGLSTAITLARLGYAVTIMEQKEKPGGMCLLIPGSRLPKEVIQSDIEYILTCGDINLQTGTKIVDPIELLNRGFSAVAICSGLDTPLRLGIENENLAVPGLVYLENPGNYPMTGNVAVIGGGATALDCAAVAMTNGAPPVEMFALENLKEMPLTAKERQEILDYNIQISGRTRVTGIIKEGETIVALETVKVFLPLGEKFNPKHLIDIPYSQAKRLEFRHVIIAIGAKPGFPKIDHPAVFYSGDCLNGPTTVVEATASGKNTALAIHEFLEKGAKPNIENPIKSTYIIKGYRSRPISLETDFFGRPIQSPFLLSAAPPTDGLEQMKAAYEAGWPGGIMKTAFDNLAIHIPAKYMHQFNPYTYGNCDNVSDHPLDRVCREVEALVKLYPDRLTMASTGGSVTGNDENDRQSWQSNTKKLEAAGVMGIEYSLSCPQGGDGTEGDIVSQNAALTAKIIDWVMAASQAEIPKLFKLTGAVTSIAVIMNAIRKVLDKYPGHKAGVTLANTFPTMIFRQGNKSTWEEGIIVGMSGESITPISYLTLANAMNSGIAISGNGGPMDYKAAADFLALGAKTVQFCTLVMKYGYPVIDHIEEGVSHLMHHRGIHSMNELIGRVQPKPITDFMALTAEKGVSAVHEDLCLSCGNCTRCPYLAITLNEEKHPVTDPSKCVGCGICTLKCFSGALYLRERIEKDRTFY